MSGPRHISLAAYLWTFAALVALAGLSLALSFVELGPWSVPIALMIAVVKMILVALVFMHLLEQPGANRLVPLAAIALLVLLVGLMAVDVGTRVPGRG